tara:strand:- start:53 stop:721 length:669 start_codon:yes stop_codon:yes gene_type:complete
MTNLITVKFGTKYGPEFVNKIYNDIKDQEGLTKFYCYTDDPYGLDEGISVIPDQGRPTLKVWWNKLRMFDRNFPLSGKTLFLDLDAKIQDPGMLFVVTCKQNPYGLKKNLRITFIDCHWKQGKLYNRLSNYDVKMNSSMILWDADDPEVHKIWDHFNTGFRDYYLRKYKGIDRFIVHEDFEYDTFVHSNIQSKKYQPDISKLNYKPVVTTYEEMEVGIEDII